MSKINIDTLIGSDSGPNSFEWVEKMTMKDDNVFPFYSLKEFNELDPIKDHMNKNMFLKFEQQLDLRSEKWVLYAKYSSFSLSIGFLTKKMESIDVKE